MAQVVSSEPKSAGNLSNRGRNRQKMDVREFFKPPSSAGFKHGAEINLVTFKMEDFYIAVVSLKNNINTTLRLYNGSSGGDGNFEPIRFKLSESKTRMALERFIRALAQAVGARGWLQQLELGFRLCKRDINTVSEALGCSSNLRKISFKNSALGDTRLGLLGKGLRDCRPLQVLDLSGCNLTDASSTSLVAILKAGVRRATDAEWQSSLREGKNGGGTRSIRSPIGSQGLTSLDLSFNALTDDASRELSGVLKTGARLEGAEQHFCLSDHSSLGRLLVKANLLRRKSAQLFLSAFKAWGILRLVDLRKNLDREDIGVLEDGKHLRFFSKNYVPFWNFACDDSIPKQGRMSRPGERERDPQKISSLRSARLGDSGSHDSSIQRKFLGTMLPTASDNCSERGMLDLRRGEQRPDPCMELDTKEVLTETKVNIMESLTPDLHVHGQPAGDVPNKDASNCLQPSESGLQKISQAGNGDHNISTSSMFHVQKEYPVLWASDARRDRGEEPFDKDLSPVNIKAHALDCGRNANASGFASPELDTATPSLNEWTSSAYSNTGDLQKRSERVLKHPFKGFASSSCVKDGRKLEEASFDSVLPEKRRGNNGRFQPKHRVRSGKELQLPRMVRKIISNKDSVQAKETGVHASADVDPGRSSQILTNESALQQSDQSTSDLQKEQVSEMKSIVKDMTATLFHLREVLDAFAESSNLDGQHNAGATLAKLQYLFQEIFRAYEP